MADSAPIMSGANEAVTTAMLDTMRATETTTEVTESQSETQPSSIPSVAAAATETSAPKEAAEEEKTTTTAGAASGPTASEPAAAAPPAAAVAAASGGGVLEMPQPPPAAVVRDHVDAVAASNGDDVIAPVASTAVDSGLLVCNITLLLPNGNRHPFRIDEKYLTKRGVEVPSVTESGHKDPFSVSVYKLKELILREWREEWEGKPASPSSIRLIHFGKLLDDKEQLRKYHFSPESPNVVHMSVKPADVLEDEEAAKGKTSNREARSREGGSGCCIIL